MNVDELYARRLRRLKRGMLGLVALFLTAVEAYYYFARGVPLVENLVDWLIGMVGAVVLVEIGFRAVENLQRRLQKEIIERKRAEEALRKSEEHYRTLVEKSVDGIIVVDGNGIVRFVNQATEALFGHEREELLDEMFGFPVVAGETTELDIVRKDGAKAVAEMRVVETDWEGKRAHLTSLRDITELVRLREELRAMSFLDILTGVYNRRGFFNLAHRQLRIAERAQREILLLVADLDGLKGINDTLGHHQGDQALIEIAQVLQETFRESDVVARIGGDEFAVLAIDASETSATILAHRLQESLEARNAQQNHPYRLSLSFGMAGYDPKSPCSIEELMRNADARMYEHKRIKQDCREAVE